MFNIFALILIILILIFHFYLYFSLNKPFGFPLSPFFPFSSPWISRLGDGRLGWNKMPDNGNYERRWMVWPETLGGRGASSWVVVSLPRGLGMGTQATAPLSVYNLFPVRALPLPHGWRHESKTQGPRDLKRKPTSPPKVFKWRLLSSYWIRYLSIFFLCFKHVLRYLICYCLSFSFLGSCGCALFKFL